MRRNKCDATALVVMLVPPNEIRRKENMNDIEKGDVYYVPMNMIDSTKENPKNVKVKEQPKQEKDNEENGDKTI